jgi:hypothetical protein
LGIQVVALAQGRGDRKEQKRTFLKQFFKDLDSNKAGKLSLKEVKGRLKKN